MATLEKSASLLMDKAELRLILEEANRDMGFVPDPDATAERAQAMGRAEGIDPDENLLSRGILEARAE